MVVLDRVEITKAGGIQLLASLLQHENTQVQSMASMALARCLQDGMFIDNFLIQIGLRGEPSAVL